MNLEISTTAGAGEGAGRAGEGAGRGVRAAVTGGRGGLLRFALALDAGVTAANAVAYLAGFALLDGWLGVPAGFLVAVGAFLLGYAAFVGWLASRARPPRNAVMLVIAGNELWALASFAMLALDAFSPTTAGQIVVAVQAIGVAGLAALQYAGLRRA